MTAYLVKDDATALDAPHSVHLLVTTRCNLSCPMCWYRRESPAELDIEFCRQLIKEMKVAGSKWLAIGGGEPFMWGFLGWTIELVHDAGLKVAVTTNGMWEPLNIEELPDRVAFSIDGWLPEHHGMMHKSDVGQVMRNVRVFDQMRKSGIFGKHKCEFGLNYIVADAGRLRRFLYPQVGCDKYDAFDEFDNVTFLLHKPEKMIPYGSVYSMIRSHSLNKKFWLDACLIEEMRWRGVDVGVSMCRQGQTSMSIDATGMVSQCSNMTEKVKFRGLVETWDEIKEKKRLLGQPRDFRACRGFLCAKK